MAGEIDRTNPDLDAFMAEALGELSQAIQGDDSKLRENDPLDELFGVVKPQAEQVATEPAGVVTPASRSDAPPPLPILFNKDLVDSNRGDDGMLRMDELTKTVSESLRQAIEQGFQAVLTHPSRKQPFEIDENRQDKSGTQWSLAPLVRDLERGGRIDFRRPDNPTKTPGQPAPQPATVPTKPSLRNRITIVDDDGNVIRDTANETNQTPNIPTADELGRRAADSLPGVTSSPQSEAAPPVGAAQPQNPASETQASESPRDTLNTGARTPQSPTIAFGVGVGGDKPDWNAVGREIGEAIRAVLQDSLGGISRGGETGLGGQGRPPSPGATTGGESYRPSLTQQVFNSLMPQTAGRVSQLRQKLRLPAEILRRSGAVRKLARSVRGYGRVGRVASRGIMAVGRMTGTMGGVAARAGVGAAASAAGGLGGAGAAAAGGTAAAFGSAASVAAAPAAAIVAAGVALKGFHDVVDSATDSVMNYNRTLGQFSGLMSVVMSESEARERFRQRDKGDRLAQSAQYLADSENKRKDATKNIEVLVGRIENYVYGGLNNIVAYLTGPLDSMIKQGLDAMGNNEQIIEPMGQALVNAAKKFEEEEVKRLRGLK